MADDADVFEWEYKSPVTMEFKLTEDKPGTFTGWLARYGNPDDYGDVILPGAFRTSLSDWNTAGKMPPLLLNHAGIPFGAVTADSLVPIGVWEEIKETEFGLQVKGRLDPMDIDRNKQVYAAMRNRSMDGLSIGYQAKTFARGAKDGEPRRTISEAKLFEGSIVWEPANKLATIDSVKSGLSWILDRTLMRLSASTFDRKSIRHLEAALQHGLGYSANEAKAICAKGFAGLSNPREAGSVKRALETLRDDVKSVSAR